MIENIVKGNKGSKTLGVLAILAIIIGLTYGLILAPPDARMGDVQRIMYLHIPSILIAYLSFFIVFGLFPTTESCCQQAALRADSQPRALGTGKEQRIS